MERKCQKPCSPSDFTPGGKCDQNGCYPQSICDGCNVRHPHEHKCFGKGCNCEGLSCQFQQGKITLSEAAKIARNNNFQESSGKLEKEAENTRRESLPGDTFFCAMCEGSGKYVQYPGSEPIRCHCHTISKIIALPEIESRILQAEIRLLNLHQQRLNDWKGSVVEQIRIKEAKLREILKQNP